MGESTPNHGIESIAAGAPVAPAVGLTPADEAATAPTRVTHERPSWDDYFMSIAGKVAERSTCLRRQIGAVIVRDKRILSTGYNGVPSGIEHCLTRGCLRDQLGIPSGERHELCRGIHAEQNAVIQAARHGLSIDGTTIYCTAQPCIMCAKILINAGIKEIVYAGDYPDALSLELLGEAGTMLRRVEMPRQEPC